MPNIVGTIVATEELIADDATLPFLIRGMIQYEIAPLLNKKIMAGLQFLERQDRYKSHGWEWMKTLLTVVLRQKVVFFMNFSPMHSCKNNRCSSLSEKPGDYKGCSAVVSPQAAMIGRFLFK